MKDSFSVAHAITCTPWPRAHITCAGADDRQGFKVQSAIPPEPPVISTRRKTPQSTFFAALCVAMACTASLPLHAQLADSAFSAELETKQRAANAAAKAYVQCSRAEIPRLDDSVSPVSEISAAVNQKCRGALQNADGVSVSLASLLEADLMKNTAVLILERRTAAREKANRSPRSKPTATAPTT